MQTDYKEIRELFKKWYRQEATVEEGREFLSLVANDDSREVVMGLMKEAADTLEEEAVYTMEAKNAIAEAVLKKYPVGREEMDREEMDGKEMDGKNMYEPARPMIAHRVHFLKTAWFRYAAVFILLLGAGIYYFFPKQEQQPSKPLVKTSVKENVSPGKEGAILTLADGRTIVLDSLGNGVIASQKGTEIILKDGLLAYNPAEGNSVGYNTLSTPRGRKFQLVLPDGSKVWLNAASSIKYPTAFTGKSREVEIEGEVYFEVESNENMPFRVKVRNSMRVDVLGTRFNINAYTDEAAITATLLQGSVKVSDVKDEGEAAMLRPGQQAALGTEKIIVRTVNAENSIAWVKGVFQLQGMDLKNALRQIARWYDVEVKYLDDVNPRLAGSAYQTDSLRDILEVIGYASNIEFTVSNKTIFVTKK